MSVWLRCAKITSFITSCWKSILNISAILTFRKKSIKTITQKLFISWHRSKSGSKGEFLCSIRGTQLAETLGRWCCLRWSLYHAPFNHPLMLSAHSSGVLLRCQTFVCCRVSILWMPQGSVWDRANIRRSLLSILHLPLSVSPIFGSISLLKRVEVSVCFGLPLKLKMPSQIAREHWKLTQYNQNIY